MSTQTDISRFFNKSKTPPAAAASAPSAAAAAASSSTSSSGKAKAKSKGKGKGKGRAQPAPPAPPETAEGWACSACTLLNSGQNSSCEACGAKRDASAASTAGGAATNRKRTRDENGSTASANGAAKASPEVVELVDTEDEGGAAAPAATTKTAALAAAAEAPPPQKKRSAAATFDLTSDLNRATKFSASLAATDDTAKTAQKPVSSAAGASSRRSSAGGAKKYTPMEQQVVDLKRKHADVLLLVECGYRFRFFGDDADVAAQILRVYAHVDHNFKVASIPTHRLAVHLRRLVDAGYKVGVVRQTESAAMKAAGLGTGTKSGTFQRKLVGIFTPATFIESAVEALMPPKDSAANAAAAACEPGESSEASASTSNPFSGSGEADAASGAAAAAAAAVAGWGEGEPQQEHWLACVYEEAAGGGGADSSDAAGIGFVAIDVRVGIVVFDDFVDATQQRSELETRVRHLRPLEFLLPAAPALSAYTERVLERYREGAVDAAGRGRVVRAERLPADHFAFDRANTSLSELCASASEAAAGGGGGGGSGSGSGGGGGSSHLSSILDLPRRCICALGALLAHLTHFGMARALHRPRVKPFRSAAFLALDAVTMRDLEVLTTDEKEKGSLLWLLNRTSTPGGYRTLREWVTRPLLHLDSILERQDAVSTLANDVPECLEPLLSSLKERGVADLEPLIASLHHRSIGPRRLHKLLAAAATAATALPSEAEVLELPEGLLRRLLADVPPEALETLERRLAQMDKATAQKDETVGALKDGAEVHPPLARKEAAVAAAEAELQEELLAIRKLLRRPALQYRTLRTGISSQLEYLVELKKTEAKSIPSDWLLVSQTKDLVRYHTPRVVRLQQALLVAREEHAVAANDAWKAFVALTDSECYDSLRRVVAARSETDTLLSLAQIALLPGYVRPTFCAIGGGGGSSGSSGGGSGSSGGGGSGVGGSGGGGGGGNGGSSSGSGGGGSGDGSSAGSSGEVGASADAMEVDSERLEERIVIKGGRHPTVEQALESVGGALVPNDVDLGINFARRSCLCITGPNMGGKSSFVRMVALIQLLGQIGSWVPAESAQLCVLDGIYTRMGAGDDLAAGMSTFMLELYHASSILRRATPRSLVIFDELGRGTSTHDGVAVAMSTLRHVVRSVGCATLFTTHYPEMAALAQDEGLQGCVVNVHMSFIESNDTSAADEGEGAGAAPALPIITFLYQAQDGTADKSYGLNTARAAGLDADVLALAAAKAKEMRDARSRER